MSFQSITFKTDQSRCLAAVEPASSKIPIGMRGNTKCTSLAHCEPQCSCEGFTPLRKAFSGVLCSSFNAKEKKKTTTQTDRKMVY